MPLIKSLVLVPLFGVGLALASGAIPAQSAAEAAPAALSAAPPSSGSDQGAYQAKGAYQGAYFAPFIRFDSDAGNLDVTFGIDQAARISLQAFDTQGKLLANLLDADEGSGFHQLSLSQPASGLSGPR